MSEQEFQSTAIDVLCLVIMGSVLWGALFIAGVNAVTAYLGRGSRPVPPSVLRSTWAPGLASQPGGDERAAGRPSSSGEASHAQQH